MASDLITNLVGIFTKDRFEEIQESHQHAADVQSEQLFNIIREAEATEWGKTYDFKTIVSYQDFRERIPVQSSQTLEPYLKRVMDGATNLLWPGMPKRILSSYNGTRIPITEQALAESFSTGSNDAMAIHLKLEQNSRLFGGYFVHVGNEGEPPMMVELEDFLRQNQPFLLSLLNRPRFTGLIRLSDNHLRQLIKDMRSEKASCFHGSVNSMKRLMNLAMKEGGTMPGFMTEAEALFYRTSCASDCLKSSKGNVDFPFPVYHSFCSPEGYFGNQENPAEDGFLLQLDTSQFYEFLPVHQDTAQPIPLEDVVLDTDYRLVITNCSGLWRYRSDGPCLRFVSTEPYRFIVV